MLAPLNFCGVFRTHYYFPWVGLASFSFQKKPSVEEAACNAQGVSRGLVCRWRMKMVCMAVGTPSGDVAEKNSPKMYGYVNREESN